MQHVSKITTSKILRERVVVDNYINRPAGITKIIWLQDGTSIRMHERDESRVFCDFNKFLLAEAGDEIEYSHEFLGNIKGNIRIHGVKFKEQD